MKEEEIRPKHLRDEFLRLSKEDIKTFFGKNKKRLFCPCPSCGENDSFIFQFKKHEFDYVECTKCETLYVNPRPEQKDINAFYVNSKAAAYWSTHLFKETEEIRRSQIFRPKAKMVLDLLNEIESKNTHGTLLDVGMGYGIFAEEINNLKCFDSIIGIEPSPSLASVCKQKGFEVIESPIEKINESKRMFSVAVSFEVIEHVESPEKFVQSIGKLLKTDGFIILSTLNLHGFELLSLWDKSESVFPPHHINFFNLNSLSILLERNSFKVIKAFTPGNLDVDIVDNHINKIEKNRFINHLLTRTSKSVKNNFQNFLKENNLSSHMWIIAKKKN